MDSLVLNRWITGPIRTRTGGLVQALRVADSVIQGLPTEEPGALTALRDGDALFTALHEGLAAASARSPRGWPGSCRRRPSPRSPATPTTPRSPRPTRSSSVRGPGRGDRRADLDDLRTDHPLARRRRPRILQGRQQGAALAALNRQLLAEAYPLALADAALALGAGTADLSRCTMLGPGWLHRLECSESILDDVVRVQDAQSGCVRFSAWSTGSALPRRYESVQIDPGAPIGSIRSRVRGVGLRAAADGRRRDRRRQHRRPAEPAHRQPRRLGNGRVLPRRRGGQGPLARDQTSGVPAGRPQPGDRAPAGGRPGGWLTRGRPWPPM